MHSVTSVLLSLHGPCAREIFYACLVCTFFSALLKKFPVLVLTVQTKQKVLQGDL